jgi:TolB-like protein
MTRHPGGPAHRRTILALCLLAGGSVRPGIAQCPDGSPPPCSARAVRAAAPGPNSVAVLYFDNLSRDTANAYLANGLTEELIVRLSQVRRLDVKSRFESLRLRNRPLDDPRAIGRALGAAYIVTGSLQQAGQRVRLSVSLVRTGNGSQVWANIYDRAGGDLLQIQSDIATEVAGAITGQLLPAEQATLVRRPTRDAIAYDLFLRGVQAYRLRGAAMLQARDFLQQAIARDSTFAQAYATLASVLAVLPYYYDLPVGESLARARAAAERAVLLDDGLAEAHEALGHVLIELYEWDAAEREIRRGLALSSQNSECLFRLGFLFYQQGRLREAIAALEQEKVVDPLYGTPAAYLASSYALAGRHEEAIAEARRARDIDSLAEGVGTLTANAFVMSGRPEEALATARRMVRITRNVRRLGYYAVTLIRAGSPAEADSLRARIERTPAGTPGLSSSLAFVLLAQGDTTRGLEYMERAAAGDGELLISMNMAMPLFDPVRANPRFAAVLRRFHLDVARLTRPDGGRSL